MRAIFKGETGIYQLHNNLFHSNEFTYNVVLTSFELYKGQSYEVDEINGLEFFKYKLDIYVPHHDEYHFLLTDEEFKKYFRLPIKDHYQIKVFSTTYECNKFLENLELDYLKDVRVTDNNLYTVTYLVKGD